MSWPGEKQRHAMSARGISSKSPNTIPQKPHNVTRAETEHGYILRGRNLQMVYDELLERQKVGLIPNHWNIERLDMGVVVELPFVETEKRKMSLLLTDLGVDESVFVVNNRASQFWDELNSDERRTVLTITFGQDDVKFDPWEVDNNLSDFSKERQQLIIEHIKRVM